MSVTSGSKIVRASTNVGAAAPTMRVCAPSTNAHRAHVSANEVIHVDSNCDHAHVSANRDHDHVSANRDHAHLGANRDHANRHHARVRAHNDQPHGASCDHAVGANRDLGHAARRLTLVGLAGVLCACGSGGDSAKPSAPPIGKLVAALLTAADTTSAPWRCAAIDAPGFGAEELKTGERAWRVASQRLERVDTDNEVVIGVVADAGGAAPRTVAALGRIRAALDTAKADIVLTLGGMGTTTDELQATIGTLSDHASWPVVALPGDLEPMTAHVSAIAALRTRGDVVLDGRSVRWIDLGIATIGTVPGAGAIERLTAGAEGCAWQAEDVIKVTTELSARAGIRIVASAEAPRQMIDGEAGGELALVPTKALPTEISLHGPLSPSPTAPRTGTRDGAGIGLSPGTADATPRMPSAHRPSAGVLVIRGTSWSWRTVIDKPDK